MKKILLTGESGMLGSEIKKGLTKLGYEFVNTENLIKFTNAFHYNSSLDLIKEPEWDITEKSNYALLNNLVDKNTIIIHTAAYVNTDKCEDYTYEAIKSNVLGTQMLVDLCQKANCNFVNFSTTAVFNPDYYMLNEGIFDEDCEINPKTIYGLTKYNAELAVKQSIKNAITIKPVFIYGDYPVDNSSNIRKILSASINNLFYKLNITLDGNHLKNYMRVEMFYEMFEQIILNIDDCLGKDFIISNHVEKAITFDNYLKIIDTILFEKGENYRQTSDFVVLQHEKDYLRNHLGVSNNFYKQFPDFKFKNPINHYEGIQMTANSIIKNV